MQNARQSRGGSNLKAKRKRLSIVFATLYAAKQGVCRAEQAQVRADDYATGADCRHQIINIDSRVDNIYKSSYVI